MCAAYPTGGGRASVVFFFEHTRATAKSAGPLFLSFSSPTLLRYGSVISPGQYFACNLDEFKTKQRQTKSLRDGLLTHQT